MHAASVVCTAECAVLHEVRMGHVWSTCVRTAFLARNTAGTPNFSNSSSTVFSRCARGSVLGSVTRRANSFGLARNRSLHGTHIHIQQPTRTCAHIQADTWAYRYAHTAAHMHASILTHTEMCFHAVSVCAMRAAALT